MPRSNSLWAYSAHKPVSLISRIWADLPVVCGWYDTGSDVWLSVLIVDFALTFVIDLHGVVLFKIALFGIELFERAIELFELTLDLQ